MMFRSPSSLTVLLGIALATAGPVILSSCDTHAPSTEASNQDEVEALRKAKVKLEGEVKQLRDEAVKRQADLIKHNEELQKEADEAKAQFEKLQDEATKARKELEEYMAKYKLGYRSKLKGLMLPSLQTADSQTFQTVVLKEITPTEVAFSHSNGAARVPLEKLPPDLQKRFRYDPGEVKRLEEARAAAAAATADLDGVEGVAGLVVQKDPKRAVNPTVVYNLRTRILTRQKEIEKAKAEALRVKRAGDDATNLGRYRLEVLQQRAARLSTEIKDLAGLLDKELNGQG